MLGSFDLGAGETGDRDLCFQGGKQVGEGLFVGFVVRRDSGAKSTLVSQSNKTMASRAGRSWMIQPLIRGGIVGHGTSSCSV